MCFSLDTFTSKVVNHLHILNPESILDVGAGSGKYGKLCKAIPSIKTIDAVEPTIKYIEEFQLQNIYTNIYQKTIQDYTIENFAKRYDIVIFGDILEHLFRSQAIDYIDYFLYRSKWVLVLWPTFMPQDDARDNTYEIHKSNFNIIDLATKFDIHHYEKKFAWHHWNNPEFTHCEYNYCLMKGYVTIRNEGI